MALLPPKEYTEYKRRYGDNINRTADKLNEVLAIVREDQERVNVHGTVNAMKYYEQVEKPKQDQDLDQAQDQDLGQAQGQAQDQDLGQDNTDLVDLGQDNQED